MKSIIDSPFEVLGFTFVALAVAVALGNLIRKRRLMEDEEQHDFDVVLTATLTLLGLIIGFSFSMIITRYDQRKTYEEEEANAIGTEYLRVQLLPPADAAKAHQLLKQYLEQRILFYEVRDENPLNKIGVETSRLQLELWAVVQGVAEKSATPVTALALSGMNDVLNSQGYTQAAWWNRFPIAAWQLLFLIAVLCNVLVGYGARRQNVFSFLALPIAVAISFFLMADLSSPRQGLIRVIPQNLVSLSDSLRTQ
jgi:hypothetical protein